jgi:hypothetical protein
MGEGPGNGVSRPAGRDTSRVLAFHLRISTRSQVPNFRQIPMFKILNLKQDRFGHLELKFGAYLGFGICDLGFET